MTRHFCQERLRHQTSIMESTRRLVRIICNDFQNRHRGRGVDTENQQHSSDLARDVSISVVHKENLVSAAPVIDSLLIPCTYFI